jgi:hypothetical protein
VIDDLAILRIAFVWHIPKEDLARLFGAKSSLELKYFGYDYDTGKFSAAEAVQYNDLIWEKMLANQTAISEASEDKGSKNVQGLLKVHLVFLTLIPFLIFN